MERHHRNLQQHPAGAPGASHQKARLLSNKTHYNPRDPDARISVKPGKARKLNYHCSMAVDTAEGVISHMQADFADNRDSQCLPSITTELQTRLKENELLMANLLADAGYTNGYNYSYLQRKGIMAWISVFGKYKAEITGFTYDKQRDYYTCPAKKVLLFRHFNKDPDGRLNKYYRAAYQDCKNCPLKKECAGNATAKSITRTAYDEQYLSAYARQHSRKGWQMKKLRQSTVEPVFGSLTQYYGLSKIGVLGKAGAHKVMLMSAIAFNLKKYLKHKRSKASGAFFTALQQALALLIFIFSQKKYS